MGRIYTVPFDDVAVSAAQDMLSVSVPSTTAVAIHSIVLGQRGLTSWAGLPLRFVRFSGAFTNPAGGSSVTPAKANFNDAASLCTCRANDTTVAGSGTAVTVVTDEWILLNNYLWLPPPEDRIILPPSQLFVLRLPTAPSASTNCSGTLTFEELC